MIVLVLFLLAADLDQPATATPQPAESKLVCKKIMPSAGSRIAVKKTCRTEAEWAADRKVSKGGGMSSVAGAIEAR